jgi:hypothetical protein
MPGITVFKVRNFEYNGFFGKLEKGYADYTAVFQTWTSDPGVGLFTCSDAKERRIPSFALEGDYDTLPKQKKTGVLFGPSCNS